MKIISITRDMRDKSNENRESIEKMNMRGEPYGINWWFKNVSTDKSFNFNFSIYLLS